MKVQKILKDWECDLSVGDNLSRVLASELSDDVPYLFAICIGSQFPKVLPEVKFGSREYVSELRKF